MIHLDEKTVKFLDTIDMEEYVHDMCFQAIRGIMDEIEEDNLFNKELDTDPHFDGMVFRHMSRYEFQHYLMKRYPSWEFDEDVQVTYLVKAVDDDTNS